MAHPTHEDPEESLVDATGSAHQDEQRTQPEGDRRVSERRLFPPRPEGRRHDGGRRDDDAEDA